MASEQRELHFNFQARYFRLAPLNAKPEGSGYSCMDMGNWLNTFTQISGGEMTTPFSLP